MKEDEARNMVLLNRTALITSCVTKTRENQSIWRTAEMTIKSYFHPLSKQASKQMFLERTGGHTCNT